MCCWWWGVRITSGAELAEGILYFGQSHDRKLFGAMLEPGRDKSTRNILLKGSLWSDLESSKESGQLTLSQAISLSVHPS